MGRKRRGPCTTPGHSRHLNPPHRLFSPAWGVQLVVQQAIIVDATSDVIHLWNRRLEARARLVRLLDPAKQTDPAYAGQAQVLARAVGPHYDAVALQHRLRLEAY